ncbi:MAG: DUF7482 domain-containing protein [Actinomycetota bacterium]
MRESTRELDRRGFLNLSARGALGAITVAGMPGLLAACSSSSPDGNGSGRSAPSPAAADVEGKAIVGDVTDFALSSDEWEGDFGWVQFRLHRGVFDGSHVFFIRTDTSDRGFAIEEKLVWAPRIGGLLSGGSTSTLYLFDNDSEPAVLSSEPGRDDYTPAWRVARVSKKGGTGSPVSESELLDAEKAGEVRIERTKIVLNASVVSWSSGEMPVDAELSDYLGGGQLIETPDTQGLAVTFKLHQCFPSSRYIVDDTSMAPMAEGMQIVHSPRLTKAPGVRATGRTNVFMNGVPGSGPMGFQPSVFDSDAGDEEWSPYWEHFTYGWKQENSAHVLRSQDEIHATRDEGELDEFPGTPDTKGEIFTVNCPVPVLAPTTFEG